MVPGILYSITHTKFSPNNDNTLNNVNMCNILIQYSNLTFKYSSHASVNYFQYLSQIYLVLWFSLVTNKSFITTLK